MGKNKGQTGESMNAFARMNFLYQAAVLASRTLPNSVLANYYGRLMKEVSKKVVERIHPEVKRTLCLCCSYPLFAGDHVNVKVKPHRKKKTKKRNNPSNRDASVVLATGSLHSDNPPNKVHHIKSHQVAQKSKKNRRPNKLIWNCNRCGFSRTFLQRPSYSLWFKNNESTSET